jgi:hypothetical protein
MRKVFIGSGFDYFSVTPGYTPSREDQQERIKRQAVADQCPGKYVD